MNKKGFTLIELLVVIAIIGMLSTLAVVALNSAREKSRDARRVSDIKQMQTALEMFYNSANSYPTNMSGTNLGYSGQVYLEKIPTAPTPNDTPCTATENTYSYLPSGTWPNISAYTLQFCLGNGTGTLTEGLRTATPGGIK